VLVKRVATAGGLFSVDEPTVNVATATGLTVATKKIFPATIPEGLHPFPLKNRYQSSVVSFQFGGIGRVFTDN
jgi:hypothetical protein